MESAFNLTMHNRITQLMKKNNEIKWTSILKYLDPQLRNVSQHFDISYNVENEVYIGKNIKGVEFEITKDDFLNKYLLPIQEVIFAILAVIFLLNIMWMDKSKGIYYIQLYFKAWYKTKKGFHCFNKSTVFFIFSFLSNVKFFSQYSNNSPLATSNSFFNLFLSI